LLAHIIDINIVDINRQDIIYNILVINDIKLINISDKDY